MRLLRQRFRPEFLNRIDETIIFRSLDIGPAPADHAAAARGDRRRLHAQDVILDVADAAVDWLVRQGYQPHFGARPLRRTIQRKLDNTLSRMLLDGTLKPKQRVYVSTQGDDLAFTVLDREAKGPEPGTEPHATASPEHGAAEGEERRKQPDAYGQYL